MQSLPGGDVGIDGMAPLVADLKERHPFLTDAEAVRIARAYGTRARVWLGDAKERGDLGRDFGAGLSKAEVDYLVSAEWASTADDVLWRRTKLGLRMDPAQQVALADYLGG
jgi:glycerol-3-phosphate dehydrogenase